MNTLPYIALLTALSMSSLPLVSDESLRMDLISSIKEEAITRGEHIQQSPLIRDIQSYSLSSEDGDVTVDVFPSIMKITLHEDDGIVRYFYDFQMDGDADRYFECSSEPSEVESFYIDKLGFSSQNNYDDLFKEMNNDFMSYFSMLKEQFTILDESLLKYDPIYTSGFESRKELYMDALTFSSNALDEFVYFYDYWNGSSFSSIPSDEMALNANALLNGNEYSDGLYGDAVQKAYEKIVASFVDLEDLLPESFF